MEQSDLIAHSIVKALAYAENGGEPNFENPKAGKTGEAKSVFQFTPDTWKQYAKEITGNENLPLNVDNETHIVNEKVKRWIKQGKTARQIASMWNAGPGEPDAYTGTFSNGSSSIGINKKFGVKFDVPSYANKVLDYSKKFYEEKSKPPSFMQTPIQGKISIQTQKESSTLDSVMSLIKKASTTPETSKSFLGGKQASEPITQNKPKQTF